MNTTETAFAYRERQPGTVVDTIVMHATATNTAQEALDILAERGLAYHFIIDRDGATIRLVDPAHVAFHAGESMGPQGPAANEYSLGVSFVNRNDGLDPYSEEQEAAARKLIASLRETVPTLEFLTTHAVIAPTRKNDPLGYDVEDLAHDTGLIFWRDQTASPK